MEYSNYDSDFLAGLLVKKRKKPGVNRFEGGDFRALIESVFKIEWYKFSAPKCILELKQQRRKRQLKRKRHLKKNKKRAT